MTTNDDIKKGKARRHTSENIQITENVLYTTSSSTLDTNHIQFTGDKYKGKYAKNVKHPRDSKRKRNKITPKNTNQ